MRERLAKLVRLANRAGTPAEGDRAREHAERLADQHGLAVVRTSTGELLVLEDFHADLHCRLQEIANPSAPRRRDALDEGS